MTILYIPGLGDDRTVERQIRYLRWWGNRHRVDVEAFHPDWHTNEPYGDKWKRLELVAQKLANHTPVFVVGVSAGASLAVRTSLETLPEASVHLVCGKLHNAEKIGPSFRQRAPALYESVHYSEVLLNKLDQMHVQRMTTFSPIADMVVPLKDQRIDHAKHVQLPIWSHLFGIVWYLAFKLPRH